MTEPNLTSPIIRSSDHRVIPCLTADTLRDLPGIRHGFFTRQGGVSEGIYASLNAGPGSRDDAAHIAENRRRIAATFGVGEQALSTLYQVHGRDVITLDAALPAGTRPQADGWVTKTPGLLLGILTADCVPVLFADPEARVVGACHAGWKGALAGVTDATIEAMEALGARRSRITAAIGPAIGWQSYEVDAGFRQNFLDAEGSNESFFRPANTEKKCLFNIKGYVAERLAKAGIETLGMLANDTCLEASAFFSYRRATQCGETDYGRQVSVIGLSLD